jgi:hypothetical protein
MLRILAVRNVGTGDDDWTILYCGCRMVANMEERNIRWQY